MHGTMFVYDRISADSISDLKKAMKKGDGIGILAADDDDAFEAVGHMDVDYVTMFGKSDEEKALDKEYERLLSVRLPDGMPMFVGDDVNLRIFHFSKTGIERDVFAFRLGEAKRLLDAGAPVASAEDALGIVDTCDSPSMFVHGFVDDKGEIKRDYEDAYSFDRIVISDWFPKNGYFVVAQAFDYHF